MGLFIRKFFKMHWINSGIYIFAYVVSGLLPIILSVKLSELVNAASKYQSIHLTNSFLLIIIFIVLFFISRYLSTYLITIFQTQLLKEVNKGVLDGYKQLIKGHNNEAGYAQKLINESENLAKYYLNDCIAFIKNFILVIYALILLMKENIGVTLILCILLFSFSKIHELINKKIQYYNEKTIEARTNYFGTIDSLIENVEQIKYFNLFDQAKNHFNFQSQRLIKSVLSILNLQISESLIIQLIRYLFIVIYIVLGIKANSLNYGSIILIISVLTQLFNYIDDVNQFFINTYKIRVSKQIIENHLNIDNHISKLPSLHFNQIEFKQFKSDRQNCKPLNFTLKKGEVYCITGENGVGKSTFFESLLGLDIDYSGEVLIDHQIIELKLLSSLIGQQIIYMDQNCELLDYIDVKDTNIKKSRGQIQQILLSEIFDHSPKYNNLYLLDEPTASLDAIQKDKLIGKIQELRQNNIIVIISHDDVLLRQPYTKVRFE